MRDLFDAADRAAMARAEQINEERADPAQRELQRLIARSGADYALAQLRELGALEGGQRAILGRTALVVTLGVALYVLLVGIFVAYRRRLERAAEAELAASRQQALTDDLTGLGNRRA